MPRDEPSWIPPPYASVARRERYRVHCSATRWACHRVRPLEPVPEPGNAERSKAKGALADPASVPHETARVVDRR